MWDYSEKVQDHFFNPRNAGAVAQANATGDVGSLSCGDALRLTLKVNPETDIIEDAGFQTFGCGSAVASSSALTEMVKGMTVDDALKISNQDIADYLDGLPPEKMHCSVMGREALQAAVANYRGVEWKDDHEEGALICKCFAVDAVLIEETIRANNLSTVEEVTFYTKAGGGCSACFEGIEEILNKVMLERDEEEVVAPPPPEPVKPAKAPLTNLQRMRRIEHTLEAIRPQLQADRGDIELVEVDFDKKIAFVNLSGACSGCQMAAATLGGVQQRVMEDLGEFIRVLPATEMGKF
ncbi:MAG: Fe-S cluster assembly protein NifU [Candidatus Thiothrix sulfatifontis]|uniref:Fe-S cluster assembly protein NifU n=1 Tax=Thiothrix lacustris TaxID=525917 RepID=UPI002050B321|nr:Fe-S cluster assembly protein NifU [Thiothrix lacustris]UOG91973.1 MAG: Fe-S cluster assembly protein NifU [Candidatus Thiothrix sulfatifontis]WMP17149.1 Fe-S cluster assembly protein NifU [Thiothrix lacustris]